MTFFSQSHCQLAYLQLPDIPSRGSFPHAWSYLPGLPGLLKAKALRIPYQDVLWDKFEPDNSDTPVTVVSWRCFFVLHTTPLGL